MAKKTKEAEDERELREVFRVFDKNSRGVIDVRRRREVLWSINN
jgi:Ca2+-binding EF-hand superfamily protein